MTCRGEVSESSCAAVHLHRIGRTARAGEMKCKMATLLRWQLCVVPGAAPASSMSSHSQRSREYVSVAVSVAADCCCRLQRCGCDARATQRAHAGACDKGR